MNSRYEKSPKIHLGTNGPAVSRLIFGTEHIINLSPEDGGAILTEAYNEFGIDHWDTAPAYESHPQVAAGLKQAGRENIIVTSKTTAETYDEAETQMEDILHELDTNYLDIAFLHNVPQGRLQHRQGALQYLIEAKKQGLINYVGLSSHCPDILLEASKKENLEIVCGTVNKDGSRIDGGTIDDMLKALKRCFVNDKGVYAIKILGRGDLTDELESAIQFVCEQPFIHAYNIGMRNIEEVRENLEIITEYGYDFS